MNESENTMIEVRNAERQLDIQVSDKAQCDLATLEDIGNREFLLLEIDIFQKMRYLVKQGFNCSENIIEIKDLEALYSKVSLAKHRTKYSVNKIANLDKDIDQTTRQLS